VKIDDAMAKSQQGGAVSAEVAKSFALIREQIHQVDTLVAEIATASSEQSQGMGQVNTAVSQMDQITQNTAANAEETAAAAEELSSQSIMLREVVGTLERLVGGRTSSPQTPADETPKATAPAPKPPHRAATPQTPTSDRMRVLPKRSKTVFTKSTSVAAAPPAKAEASSRSSSKTASTSGHSEFFRDVT
jgi:methyl-accepting chemotaxis protein